MNFDELKYDIKKLLIEECEKEDFKPEEIKDDVMLFSDDSGLELDSVDALQFSMSLQKKYGVRLGDSKDFRRTVTTVEKLAQYIIDEQND
jgi:acyl carrier protein